MAQHPKVVQADKRGQVVIPKSVRAELNIEEGAAFWVYKTEDGIFLKKIKEAYKYIEQNQPSVLKVMLEV